MRVICTSFENDWQLLSGLDIDNFVKALERKLEELADKEEIRRQLKLFAEEGVPVNLDDERDKNSEKENHS